MGSFPRVDRGRDEDREVAHFPEPIGGAIRTGQRILISLRCRAHGARSPLRDCDIDVVSATTWSPGAFLFDEVQRLVPTASRFVSPISPRLRLIRGDWSRQQGSEWGQKAAMNSTLKCESRAPSPI